MIERTQHLLTLEELLQRFPVVAILGTRQTGKTTLARQLLARYPGPISKAFPGTTLGRFWTMIAHYHGQIWNSSELARAFGVSDTTVARYRDILTGALVVRQITPWHENLQKRQVKSPKVYIIDSGLLHTLLNLETFADLAGHPKIGASWEGFGLAEVIARLGARPRECFFWSTHSGAELDLLVVRGRRRLGFEFKYSDAPQITRSMHIALADLKLDSLDMVHAGQHTFPLAEKVRALSLSRINKDLAPLAESSS